MVSLQDEWKDRDVKEGLEYAILTAEISRATFGLAPSQYKNHKGLKRENLRDHMTMLELLFTQIGEEQTRIEAVKRDAQGLRKIRTQPLKGEQLPEMPLTLLRNAQVIRM